MSDLISRQAAIDAVNIDNLHRGIVDALQNIIMELPSADVVPVVRCKDCKYYYKYIDGEGDCKFHEWYQAEPNDYDFCSRGERKGNV